MVDTLQGVNLGLMRYSNNEGGDADTSARGGMVTYPVTELNETTRGEMKRRSTPGARVDIRLCRKPSTRLTST